MGLFEKWIDKFTNLLVYNPQNKRVLLIDEIDVLFDRKYFGDTFNQSIELHDENTIELFKFIWANKTDASIYKKVQSSTPFQKLVLKHEKLRRIL